MNWAAVAGPPSPALPFMPLPATVVITPAADTRRTRKLPVSAITRPPSAVGPTAYGRLICAAVAGPPSPENPRVPVPATVVIVPLGDTRRIRELPVSAIRNPPAGSAATPLGAEIAAAVAGPPSPENPDVPLPATVVIMPVADTRRISESAGSAIKMLPSGSAATPSGALSWADVAGPPSPENPKVPV